MPIRQYANAPATTLTAAVTAVATSLPVASVAGLPISYPFTLIIDRGTATEEAVSVTAAAGLNLTVTRGIDSTTAFAHAIDATVAHGITAQDVREPNVHINASTGVHGITGAVVGTTDTQTLSGKTLTAPAATGSLASFGEAWTAYTPTLAGGFTAGTGATLEGWYIQIGKIVFFKARWILGTGFTIGNGIGLSLPVNAHATHSPGALGGSARLASAGVNVWHAGTTLTTTSINPYVVGSNGVATAISSTVPFTWKATDSFEVAGIYEAA